MHWTLRSQISNLLQRARSREGNLPRLNPMTDHQKSSTSTRILTREPRTKMNSMSRTLMMVAWPRKSPVKERNHLQRSWQSPPTSSPPWWQAEEELPNPSPVPQRNFQCQRNLQRDPRDQRSLNHSRRTTNQPRKSQRRSLSQTLMRTSLRMMDLPDRLDLGVS